MAKTANGQKISLKICQDSGFIELVVGSIQHNKNSALIAKKWQGIISKKMAIFHLDTINGIWYYYKLKLVLKAILDSTKQVVLHSVGKS